MRAELAGAEKERRVLSVGWGETIVRPGVLVRVIEVGSKLSQENNSICVTLSRSQVKWSPPEEVLRR
jgi:hypothetical protein